MLNKIKAFFGFLDRDKDGKIEVEDLTKSVKAVNEEINKKVAAVNDQITDAVTQTKARVKRVKESVSTEKKTRKKK